MSKQPDKKVNSKRMQSSLVVYYKSPIGYLELEATDLALSKLDFVEDAGHIWTSFARQNSVLTLALQQLDEYFAGKRRDFTVPLQTKGTDFQMRSWEYLMQVPFGETRSYFDQALAIGNAKAVRAVAHANHNNPIALIIPCHRVIGKNGNLTGYGGGLWRKKWLLEHERALV